MGALSEVMPHERATFMTTRDPKRKGPTYLSMMLHCGNTPSNVRNGRFSPHLAGMVNVCF
jgi:hypothetical protein